MTGFVNFRQHAPDYLGTVSLEETATRLRAEGAAYFPLLMHGSLAMMAKHRRIASQFGLKPITAVMLPIKIAPQVSTEQFSIVAVVESQKGYENLCSIISDGERQGTIINGHFDGKAEIAASQTEGMSFLLGGQDGALAYMYRTWGSRAESIALSFVRSMKQHFGKCHLEIQATGQQAEPGYWDFIKNIAAQTDTPVIATHDSLFANADGYAMADLIAQARKTDHSQQTKLLHPDGYFRTPAQLGDLFANEPEAVAQTLRLAQTASVWQPEVPADMLPQWGADKHEDAQILREQAVQGLEGRLLEQYRYFSALKQKYGVLPPMSKRDDVAEFVAETEAKGGNVRDTRLWQQYAARLDGELGLIADKGLSSYFLIVADYVGHAKQAGILVGAGRGSAAGSLAAYALGITEVDSVRYGLLFERFINPARQGLPDIDVDFAADRIGEVVDYLKQRYGSGNVLRLATYSDLKPRNAIERAAAVYGLNNRHADVVRLKQQLPREDDALMPPLNEFEQQGTHDGEILALAQQLCGLPNNRGTHAAGIALLPMGAERLFPTFPNHKENAPVLAYDKDDSEQTWGVVKFDVLSLGTLSVIAETFDLIEQQTGQPLQRERAGLFDWYDPDVYHEIFQKGDLLGVFQSESATMTRLFANFRPDSLEQIAFLTALGRKSALPLVPEVLDIRHGRKPMVFFADNLQTPVSEHIQNLLTETYGIMVYQEQVMEILKDMGGFSLSEADNMRRILSKKDETAIKAQREKFVDGAVALYLNGQATPEQQAARRHDAERVFDLIEDFAGYGFNKSHAYAYAMMIYQTAWLKQKHPHAFFTATLNHLIKENEKHKIPDVLENVQQHGCTVHATDINRSEKGFSLKNIGGELCVVEPLAVRQTNDKELDKILSVRPRTEGGGYAVRDFAHLQSLLGGNINASTQKTLDSLIRAGAFSLLDGQENTSRLLQQNEKPPVLAAYDADAAIMLNTVGKFATLPAELLACLNTVSPPDREAAPDADSSLPPLPQTDLMQQQQEIKGFCVQESLLRETAAKMKDVLAAVQTERGTLYDAATLTAWRGVQAQFAHKYDLAARLFQSNPDSKTAIYDQETVSAWGFIYEDTAKSGKKTIKACLFGQGQDGAFATETVRFRELDNRRDKALYQADMPMFQPCLLVMTVKDDHQRLPVAAGVKQTQVVLDDVYPLSALVDKQLVFTAAGNGQNLRTAVEPLATALPHTDCVPLQYDGGTAQVRLNEHTLAALQARGIMAQVQIPESLLATDGTLKPASLGGHFQPFEPAQNPQMQRENAPAVHALLTANPLAARLRVRDLTAADSPLPSADYLVAGVVESISPTKNHKQKISLRLPDDDQTLTVFAPVALSCPDVGQWAVLDIGMNKSSSALQGNFLTVNQVYSEQDIAQKLPRQLEADFEAFERLNTYLTPYETPHTPEFTLYEPETGQIMFLDGKAADFLHTAVNNNLCRPMATPSALNGTAAQYQTICHQWQQKSPRYAALKHDPISSILAGTAEHAHIAAMVVKNESKTTKNGVRQLCTLADHTHSLTFFLPDHLPVPEAGSLYYCHLTRNRQGDWRLTDMLSPEQALTAHIRQCGASGTPDAVQAAAAYLQSLPHARVGTLYVLSDGTQESRIQAAVSPDILKNLRGTGVSLALAYDNPDAVHYPSSRDFATVRPAPMPDPAATAQPSVPPQQELH